MFEGFFGLIKDQFLNFGKLIGFVEGNEKQGLDQKMP